MTTPALRDQFGRSIEYLRISVTDRCNFRCVYCMPLEGLEWLPKSDILSYEEITAVVRQLAPLGLRRLRITGGEPLLHKEIVQIVEGIIARKKFVYLCTNALLLKKKLDQYGIEGKE